MIKVNGTPKLEQDGTVKVDLLADTATEVEDIGTDGSTVVGLNEGTVLAFGCTCFTTEMEFGILNSTGNWRFE